MIKDNPEADLFKYQMRDSLRREVRNSRSIQVAKHANTYIRGGQDEMVYFAANGQVKLLMFSPEGKACQLAIRTAGDAFGELCLSGLTGRLETAVGMEESGFETGPLRQISLEVPDNTIPN